MIIRKAISTKSVNRFARIWASTLPSCSMIGRNQANMPPLLTASRWPALGNKRAFSGTSNNRNNDEIPPDPDGGSGEIAVYDEAPLARFDVPENFPNVPIVAINRYPYFPGYLKKIDLKQNQALMNLIKAQHRAKQPFIGVFVKKDNENKSEVVTSISQLYNIGTFAHISQIRDNDGKMLEMVVQSHRRIRILNPVDPPPKPTDFSRVNERRNRGSGSKRMTKAQQLEATMAKEEEEKQREEGEQPLIYARTENVEITAIEQTPELKLKMQAIITAIREIAHENNLFQQHIFLILPSDHNIVHDPMQLCDFVGTIMQNAEVDELQKLLEESNIMRRIDFALELLEKENLRLKTMRDIRESVTRRMQEQHHKLMLHEQLKAIKRELGIEKEDKQAVLEKLEDRLKDLIVPEYAMKVIKEEQAKLAFLDPHSSEFSISRNYLDWLTNIPWGKTSEEMKDVKWAQKVLDEDHYGMDDVKKRILEFIAVGILKQQTNGKILCFHGPPGVGKTSIAKSIARALNRQYYRFSVGGMTDVAEIKGHRRTYIGAMPGKLIQCLKKVQTENPLVLIDEVDKIGGPSHHGDPSSALLEVLDPEQNANFLDHFMDVPVDLSKVLFICTANVLDPIPGPLKDRMEMIEVSGYVAEEKLEIAKKFLVPKCREKCALPEDKLVIEDDAIISLIKSYCRESGVRSLEKHLEKIFRKAAYRLVSEQQLNFSPAATDAAADGQHGHPAPIIDDVQEADEQKQQEKPQEPIVVSNANIKDFVGREKFTSDRLYETTPPGVIMGLAWTAMGGSALYIEATLSRKLRPADASTTTIQAGTISPATGQPPQQPPAAGSLEATGHLGEVMKESMRIAHTVAKNVLMAKDPNNDFLELAHIHVHVPEGAVSKEGPSAGCAIVSALLSLALGQPAVQGIAMTGETSLTGKVLPIGGVKEKIIAAKRAGVDRVILPEENRKDFDELPEFIRQDVSVHFVSHYDNIFALLFPDFKRKTG